MAQELRREGRGQEDLTWRHVCLATEVVVFEAHLPGMVLTHWVTWDRVSAVSGPVSPAACKERILPSITPSMSRGQSDAKRR